MLVLATLLNAKESPWYSSKNVKHKNYFDTVRVFLGLLTLKNIINASYRDHKGIQAASFRTIKHHLMMQGNKVLYL